MHLTQTTATGYPTFATYNTSASLWACCGVGGCNGTLTGETFSAIAQAQWSAVPTTATNSWNVAATVSIPTSTSSATSATTSAASTTASTNSTPTTSASQASGLSTGAKAGIGIGIAVPVVALLAGLTLLLLRRRQQKGAIELRNDYSLPPYNEAMQHTAAYKYGGRVQSSELNGTMPESRQELDAASMPHELPTEHAREQKA
ncbi:hypothetical protein LTR86_004749 [Recurvomyces mirabilis]|nr:hypothetical protein LTR86_004749 [Recurvomyces mirabilis]